jgi:hypothetical protein
MAATLGSTVRHRWTPYVAPVSGVNVFAELLFT